MSVGINAKTDDLITRFLLGELSEQERAEVEERFLTDNHFFEEVLAVEDALLDQYLNDQISGEQLEHAQTLFQSSPGQKRELEFTKELIASLREANLKKKRTTLDMTPSTFVGTTDRIHSQAEADTDNDASESPGGAFTPPPPGLKHFSTYSNATAWLLISLACITLLVWAFYHYYQKRSWEAQMAAVERSNQEARDKLSELTQGQAELNRQLELEKERRARAEELIAQLENRKPGEITRPDGSDNAERTTSLLLSPAALDRGGNSKTVRLKAGSKPIQLQLELGEGKRYSRYSLLLTTFDGRKVWSKDSIDASQIRQGRLFLTLPSSLLEYEDYRIELKGLADNGELVHVADYIFKVRR